MRVIQKLRLNVTLGEDPLPSDRWGPEAGSVPATCSTLSIVKPFDSDKLLQPDGDTPLLKVSYFKAVGI